MNAAAREAFQINRDRIISRAAEAWGTRAEDLRALGDFESFVFEYTRDNKSYIMKVTHAGHRSADLVRGEIDWIRHLCRHGVAACPAVPAGDGDLACEIPVDGTSFVVSTFEKAPGRHVKAADLTGDLFEQWGSVLGSMHAATQHYRPTRELWRRYDWHADPTLVLDQYRKFVDAEILACFERRIDAIKDLAVTEDSYGLIHNDLHPGNFFVHQGRMQVFDFDDCHYNFLVNDIAMALFYALRPRGQKPHGRDFATHFLTCFMRGYRREFDLSREWLEMIPLFLRLREIDLYCLILYYEAEDMGPWVRDYMAGRRERILGDVPVVEADFASF